MPGSNWGREGRRSGMGCWPGCYHCARAQRGRKMKMIHKEISNIFAKVVRRLAHGQKRGRAPHGLPFIAIWPVQQPIQKYCHLGWTYILSFGLGDLCQRYFPKPWNMRLAVNIVHGFRSKMASGGDNGNLVQEFEEAFQVEISGTVASSRCMILFCRSAYLLWPRRMTWTRETRRARARTLSRRSHTSPTLQGRSFVLKRILQFIQESGNLLLEQEVPDLQPQARVHFERGDRRPSTHAAKISSLCFRTPWSWGQSLYGRMSWSENTTTNLARFLSYSNSIELHSFLLLAQPRALYALHW